ncbi:MAG: hypothetical protein LBJ42_00180 [Holosporales bacterium]|jgi:lysozyme family protein|nr:hypothetical protein [Holosporales bacterium]
MNLKRISVALTVALLAACSSSRFGRGFDYAISKTLANEGGYVNDPDDPGGETKYGISKRSYPNLNIKNLTVNQAKLIYYKDYWLKAGLYRVHNEEVAAKLFDILVNFGDEQAREITQRAILSAYKNAHLARPGSDWSSMVQLINNIRDYNAFLASLRSEQASVYRLIAYKKGNMKKFLTGWLNRAYT